MSKPKRFQLNRHETARETLKETHNKRFYGVSVARLEAALKLDEEMTKEELKESLGI